MQASHYTTLLPTTLLFFPAMRSLGTCSSSRPRGSSPSSFHFLFLRLPPPHPLLFFSFLSSSSLKPRAPPFSSTDPLQALAFIWPVRVGSSEVTPMEHGGRTLHHFTAGFSRRCTNFTPTKNGGSYGSLVKRLWLEKLNQQYFPKELCSDFPSLHFPGTI